MRPRWLRAIVLLAAVYLFVLSGAPVFAQDFPTPDVTAKPERDAPFPAPPDASSMAAAAANLPAATAGVDQWSKLVYQSFRDGNWEIYLTKGDGSAPVNLSQHQAADARPQINLGATRVVFNSDRSGNVEIYTINTDGSGLARLTFDHAADFAPAWSPDSKRIAFVSDRTGNNEIFVMNADGTSPVRLSFADDPDGSPAWSPDGQWIAWKRTSRGSSTIYMIHPDGSGVTEMARGLVYAGDLRWSPISELLTDADIDGDYWNEVVRLHYMYWGHWEVTPLIDANQPFVDLWAGAYAPDSSSIAFSMVQYVIKGRNLLVGRTDILSSNVNSGALGVLAGTGYDLHPSWQNADLVAPTSHVAPLPELVQAGRIPIHLEGVDHGPSGINTFDVQCAPAADGPWADMATNIKGTETYLACGEPGDTIWLRSRATDYAGNVEAWSPVADAHTQLYLWAVDARGVDNRGVIAPNATLTSSPDAFAARSSSQPGASQLLYTTEQTYTLGMTAPGYGAAPPAVLHIDADIRHDLLLPPTTELIRNGGFEDGLNAWQGDGAIAAGDPAGGAHSGGQGLALGSSCTPVCFSGPHLTELDYDPFSRTKWVIDKYNTLHVVRSLERNGDGQLYYQIRSFDTGLWSELEPLPPTPPSTTMYELIVVVDGQGTPYVVMRTATPKMVAESRYDLLYTQRVSAGAWTPYTSIVNNPSIAVWQSPIVVGDPQAGLHILVEGRYYYQLQTPGSWLPMLDIYAGRETRGAPAVGMAVGDDGVVHFVGDLNNVLTYRTLTAERKLSGFNELGYEEWGITSLGLWVGSHGAVHMIWDGNYRSRNSQGYWTLAQPIAHNRYYTMHLLLDTRGRLHVFGKTELGTDYFVKTLDSGWSWPQVVNIPWNIWTENIALSAKGVFQLHYLESSGEEDAPSQYVYWSSPIGSTGTITSVSQAVTLPTQMMHPTLSFFHKALSGDPAGQARLSVHIDDGVSATTVFSTPAAVAWTQNWVDMAPWLGKTVTVTFSVEQADAEPLLAVYLDDISLGPWTTPVISVVEPAQIDNNWDGAPITVRGDNFTAGSTLRLGETALAAAFIDEHTLQATVLAGLAAGRYDLWVQNPNGQQNVAGGGFTLGAWNYLPVVRK
jgi:TolB protein